MPQPSRDLLAGGWGLGRFQRNSSDDIEEVPGTIKRESIEDVTPTTVPLPKGGYLSEKSAYVQQSKRMHSHHDPASLLGECFETTGVIVGTHVCVSASHVLLDTAATCSFVSDTLVRRAGLRLHDCRSKSFLTSHGLVTHDRYVDLQLYIAGVEQRVMAFVDAGDSAAHHLLLGAPALRQFLMQSNHAVGDKQEARWSVAQDLTGLRQRRYVLREDLRDQLPVLRVLGMAEGMELATRAGETATERNSRQVVERSRARHQALVARHTKKVKAVSGQRSPR